MFDFLSKYIFATPDFGHSDFFSLNLAGKFLLSNSLKAGYFPVWSKDIGNGFPTLGEGQLGMFNFYNLIAFKFLDPITAINIGYIVIFLTTITGAYLFARTIKLSRIASMYFGMIFSLSGVFVTHISHFNLIQTASFLPWEFFLVEKYLQTDKKRWLFILSLIVSQQIFSGFPQLVLISLIGIGLYLIRKNLRQIFTIGCFIFLGVIFALPQIIPSYELVRLSFRNGISIPEMARFPLNPKHLLSFLNPYLFGDPRIGTYPHFSPDWGIFWESTGYIGILPLLLLLKSKPNKTHIIILVVSLILMLGKFTPFFFLFQLPPLNLFRVPARFLFLFVWILCILAAKGLNNLRGRVIVIVILVLSIIDIFQFAAFYNPAVSTNEWLANPETTKTLKSDTSWFRVYSFRSFDEWNNIFYSEGWKNPEKYLQFQNSLDPNENLIWQITSSGYYHSGLTTRRQELWSDILENGLIYDSENNTVRISSQSAKLLSLSGTKYVISPKTVNETNWLLFASTSSQPHFYIYKNPSVLPHAYLTRNIRVVSSINDLINQTTDPSSNSTILEKKIDLQVDSQPVTGTIQVEKNTDNLVSLSISNPEKNSLMILSDSFYPTWRAYLDGVETEIYPANINQRAILIPSGNHRVIFMNDPFKFFGL